jgi:hypothetical protein
MSLNSNHVVPSVFVDQLSFTVEAQ